jgi:hypothetical protein
MKFSSDFGYLLPVIWIFTQDPVHRDPQSPSEGAVGNIRECVTLMLTNLTSMSKRTRDKTNNVFVHIISKTTEECISAKPVRVQWRRFASSDCFLRCCSTMSSCMHGQDTEDGQCSVIPIMPLAASPHTNGKVLSIQLRFPFLCIAEEALPAKHLRDEMKAQKFSGGCQHRARVYSQQKSNIWCIKLLTFWILSIVLSLFKRTRFGDWTMSLSSGKKPTQLGSIDRASPYLRTIGRLFIWGRRQSPVS